MVALIRNISRHGLNLPLTHPELEANRMVGVTLSETLATENNQRDRTIAL
ncbi:MAG TPA: hypothetical protein VK971_09980 [Thiohalobacter sp.]|nr:hypothetical protein [Thiohalobacter sp.]